MSQQFRYHARGALGFRGALCFLVALLLTNSISNPLSILELDSALRKEYPEVYPPGSDPGFTRNKAFFKLNGDDPDQIRLSLDSSRSDLSFDPDLLEALEGLILPELYERLKAAQSPDGVTLRSLQDIGLPVQMGHHALIMIPVPEDKKHPNQRAPRTKPNVPFVLAQESDTLNKMLVSGWTPPPPPPPPPIDTTPVPFNILLDAQPLGETVLQWNEDSTEFSFRSPKLKEALEAVAPSAEKSLLTTDDGQFHSQGLKSSKVGIQLDKRKKQFLITTPETWKPLATDDPPLVAPLDTQKLDVSQLSKDELFARIFQKDPPKRQREIMVQLVMDGRTLDQVRVIWDPTFTNFTFYSAFFDQALDSILEPKVREKTNGVDGNFHSDRLKQGGFLIKLDEDEYILSIHIPPDLKSLQVHSFQQKNTRNGSETMIVPAKVSAFLNMNFYDDIRYSERFFEDDSAKSRFERYNGKARPLRNPYFVDLDGAIAWNQLILQSTGSIAEKTTKDGILMERGETQIIRDFEAHNSRLTVGDIGPVFAGTFMSSPLVGGVRFDGGKALRQERNYEDNSYLIHLIRPAKVEVYVNGELKRTFHLLSGQHRIHGIPGVQGNNEVEFRVTYEDGYQESIPYHFMQGAPQNLRKGEVIGGYALGTERISQYPSATYSTQTNRMITTGLVRYGITHNLTGSTFAGATMELVIAGISMLWSPVRGTTYEARLSMSHDSLMGWGRQIQLSLFKIYDQITTTFSLQHTQAYYNSVFYHTAHSARKDRYFLSSAIGFPVWKGMASLNASATFNRNWGLGIDTNSAPIDYMFGASYGMRIIQNLNVNISGSCTVNENELIPSLTATVSYFFGREKHGFYALNQTRNQREIVAPSIKVHRREDTVVTGSGASFIQSNDSIEYIPSKYKNSWKNLTDVGWSWSNAMGLNDGKSYAINGGISEGDYSARANLQHSYNHGVIGASYSLSDHHAEDLIMRNHYLSLRASSSFMFADGLFGVGRPVQNGFILVNGQEDLDQTDFRVNPSEQHQTEFSKSNGPLSATYTNLSTYQEDFITVKLVAPPVGAYLETDQYYVDSKYKQGYALRLGSKPRVMVRMHLIDESSQSVGYTTFNIYLKSDSKKIPVVQSFTNKNGVLQAAGLIPGETYIIQFGEDAFIRDFEFTVPGKSRGILNLGELRIVHEQLSIKLSSLVPVQKKKD